MFFYFFVKKIKKNKINWHKTIIVSNLKCEFFELAIIANFYVTDLAVSYKLKYYSNNIL